MLRLHSHAARLTILPVAVAVKDVDGVTLLETVALEVNVDVIVAELEDETEDDSVGETVVDPVTEVLGLVVSDVDGEIDVLGVAIVVMLLLALGEIDAETLSLVVGLWTNRIQEKRNMRNNAKQKT